MVALGNDFGETLQAFFLKSEKKDGGETGQIGQVRVFLPVIVEKAAVSVNPVTCTRVRADVLSASGVYFNEEGAGEGVVAFPLPERNQAIGR